MSSTSKRGLSLKEIVGIIKAGHECGVQELRFGDLSITYGSISAHRNEASQIINDIPHDPEVFSHSVDLKVQTEEEKRADEEAYIEAQKLINDPLLHETDLIEDALKEG